ncbi:MAG TPA: hypothetical protein VJJ98_12820, partial [Sedimentisphaerales bacterium]|nr:hypothetical protein [Sedimentisphaerales bacterium]
MNKPHATLRSCYSAKSAAKHETLRSTRPHRKTASQNSSIANVLIVDNDPQLARLMLEILAQKGVRGIIAETADAAIHCLEKADYSLVFISDPPVAGQRQGDAA